MFWPILIVIIVVAVAFMLWFDHRHPGALRGVDRRAHRDEPESKGFDRYGPA